MPEKRLVGWREWVAFPELGIPALKAKIDTGARTSALHVSDLRTFRQEGVLKASFTVHPLRRRQRIALNCCANVIDQRIVTDSGGHREQRFVIRSPIQLGDDEWPIEITLTNRETMLFRVLLGRTAMLDRLSVDPSVSYLYGRQLRKIYRSWKGQQHVGKPRA